MDIWLRALATNAAKNFYKSPANHYEYHNDKNLALHELARDEIRDNAVPTYELDAQTAHHSVPGWNRLTHQEREAIIRKDVDGMPCKQVAEVVGCTEHAIWNARERAKKKLHEVNNGV